MITIRKIKSDPYLKKFIQYCKEEHKDNLTAIAIYGSRVWGSFNKKSDYDIFLIVKNKSGAKKIREKSREKFKQVSLAYYVTIDELKKRINNGEWAVYFVLKEHAKTLHQTAEYKSFLKWIKNYKPNIKIYLKRYVKKRNQEDFKALHGRKGWSFIKWVYLSIRKRLYMITYSRFGKSSYGFIKDIQKNKDIFSKEELNLLANLHKKYYNRKKKTNKKTKMLLTDVFKKVNNQIERLSRT